MATKKKNRGRYKTDAAEEDVEQVTRPFAFKDFNVECFNPESEEWEYWYSRFNIALRSCQIEDDGERRRYLIAKTGAKPFRVLVDFFHPEELENINYDDLIGVLKKNFGRKDVSLSERLKFTQMNRFESESVTEYVARLRAQAARCQFGASLMERLRDQLLLGINETSWQQEILRKYPSVKSSFDDIESLSQLLENAKVQQENIQTCKVEKNSAYRVKDSLSRNPNSKPSVVLQEGQHCFNCGGTTHQEGCKCPATGVECRYCRRLNHFARVCIKTGKVKIVRKKLGTHRVHEQENSSSDEEQVDFIRRLEKGCEAILTVRINGVAIDMLFDSGASKSVMSEDVWRSIGSPRLRKAASLVAYTGLKVETLGEATVRVMAFNKTMSLPIIVSKVTDVPLFGMNWILAFQLPLPKGAKVRKTGVASAGEDEKWISNTVQLLQREFSEVFKEGTGTIRNHKAIIHLKHSAEPKIFRPRRVPFALQGAIEKEIDRLVSSDILEPVDPTITPIEWASPLVVSVKSNGKIRLCGDFKVTINKFIHSDHHPIPTFEYLVAKLNGGTHFSIIDLRDAYLQMEVDEASRKYLVISTHKGFFRYKRLPFGVSFAPGLFQRTIEQILTGIPGVANYLDDIIITATSKDEHLSRVKQVLQRLKLAGLRTQQQKCKWFKQEIVYLGHLIDRNGIRPTQDHVEAVVRMPDPRNVKELRSMLGSFNYYSKFVPNLQPICAPLHELLCKGVKWQWTSRESNIVKLVKEKLVSADCLTHYDASLPLILTTDACDVGVGAVLSHRYPDNTEKPICFASRTLTASEKGYSALDKETLGIIFGLSKFRQYLCGRHFTIRTDHKPLIHLLGEKNELPKLAANRLTRWAIIVSGFDYEIQYLPGRDNPADALSRLPLTSTSSSEHEKEGMSFGAKLLQIRLDDISLTTSQLKRKSLEDENLSRIIKFLQHGWPNQKEAIPKIFHTFFEKRHELSYEEGVLMWQGRIVIPSSLRASVLHILHEGHPGITGMRAVARTHVWWPNLDKDIEGHVHACSTCQETRPKDPEVPLFSWSVPQEPWSRLHIDFCGPFQKKYWLIVVDSTTKWLEIFPMEKITACKTINLLRELFGRAGLPRTLVSDNGPQFTSSDFRKFCKDNNIRHITSTPYHPKTNGLAEREVKTFKQRMKAMSGVTDINLRLQQFLFSYRVTPQRTTGRSPAELFYGRRIKSRLDLLRPSLDSTVDTALVNQKKNHDYKVRDRSFEEGDSVWVQDPHANGKPFVPGVINKRTGLHSYLVDVGGIERRKHADQMRRRVNDEEFPKGEKMWHHQ